MNLAQIENNLKLVVYTLDKETFIYNLLESYYLPKASISRLQKGSLNLSKVPGEVSWKKKLFFKEELKNDLHLTISSLKDELKHNQRFVIITDYKTLLAIDTLTKDQLDIPITDLPKYYDFFLPWAGMEKATHAAENPADVKAAEKMAKLFDEIKKDNPDTSPEFIHNLNIFFSRLLFCYFAEDTNIFEDNQFSHAVESHTRADGSDLDTYLNRLFWVLNTPVDKRGDIPNYLNAFPYVNGGLFREEIPCPKFTSKSRQLLIDSGDSNDWSAINPDIFGSMFQAVISAEHRGGLGAHYTSVPNIMKVIEPLFLNELKAAFEGAIGNEKKLKELLHRIAKIKLFDPACGSGNFLIIAYKELRRLEMQIIKELSIVRGNFGLGTLQLGSDLISSIHLNNFYGIELDDFAHEIAKLSLWLAEHQMNVEFFNEFGRTNPTLPLQEAGQIVCGNACRLDWEKVCLINEEDEIYIFGNPPYLGSSIQNYSQKEDMSIVLKSFKIYKNLDYIACWFYKASHFIKGRNASFAFVSTNSICQGEQINLLWPRIYSMDLAIQFAYTSFKWRNNAKQNAGVSVIIVGVRNINNLSQKFLFTDNQKILVSNINSYLLPLKEIKIEKKSKSISGLPEMTYGNKAVYGEPLILVNQEKERITHIYPNSESLFKKFLGAKELMDNTFRWVLWLNSSNINIAAEIPEIKERIEEVKQLRLRSSDQGARKLAEVPYQFRDILQTKTSSIVIPLTTSEKRKYIPIDFRGADTILSNAMSVIYNASPWLFSVLNSQMHMVWVRITSGKLEDRIRYSSSICFNTFPFPRIPSQRIEELTHCTFRILEEREKHPEKTLAQLYDPDKMPEGLKEAHRLNDEAVERCYRSTPFNSDEERLEYLFKLYEKMIQEEKEKGTLFEGEKKTRKKN
jgi:type I restriction-modification system DNA methylase subunit